ncbi:MAG: cobalamin biosynthesis protein [Gammaproteobacteria bacterium]|nr:cobalamin biosynthesis protein [Gammaproteobacteria bacterium]
MIFHDPWTALVIVLSALLLDRLLGEPFIYHPLVGFGRIAAAVERLLRRESHSPRRQVVQGALAVTLLVLPPVLLVVWLDSLVVVSAVTDIILLYLALGLRSLQEHGAEVVAALEQSDLPRAREQVGLIVSRNTADMDEPGVVKATVESVLENGSDAVIGTLFWFLLFGGAGAVLYRLVNTLDAMWGYKTEHYLHFGRAAARLDDWLNWLPARLTVLLYGLGGRLLEALRAARRQGREWESPNAGPVMASGATALALELGGSAVYGEERRERPLLGMAGHPPNRADIDRALRLVRRSVILIVVLQLLIAGGWTIA